MLVGQDGKPKNSDRLLPRFPSVVVFAQHMAIFWDGFAAQVPGGDVVGFHVAHKASVAFGAAGYIRVDALLGGHVVIHHQGLDFGLQLLGVEQLAFEFVVQAAPVDAFHFLAVGREGQARPFNHVAEIGP